MTKVKVCGITTLADGLAAIAAGADLLGFNFYPPSPRYLPPAQCAEIVAGLRARQPDPARAEPVVMVGVFVNTPPEAVAEIIDRCGLDLAQFSGDEPAANLATLGNRAFKVLRPGSLAELEEALQMYSLRAEAPAWLIDAFRPGEYGGTGQTADWSLARALARQAPILLAGGLTSANVATAIAQVRPWGVDVASGVEAAPGRKDRARMDTFIKAVQRPVEETTA